MSTEKVGQHCKDNVVPADFGKAARDNLAAQKSSEKAKFISFCNGLSLSARDADAIWSKVHAANDKYALTNLYFAAAEAVARKTLVQEVPLKD